MAMKCNTCQETFPSQGKRDAHIVEHHISRVQIAIITRTSNRFACPVCAKTSKNARTFRIHLKRHNLSCTSIVDSPQSNATAPGTQGSPSAPSDTSASSSDDTLLALDFVQPVDDDRLVFLQTDVSLRFYDFQLSIKRRIDSKQQLTLEENVQHILALSSILLLKPARTHADLHEFISLQTCDAFAAHILTSNNITGHKFPAATKATLEQIVDSVTSVVSMNASGETRSCSRIDASRQITALLEGDTLNETNKILLTIRNMVETLPRRVFSQGPQETELITRHLQSSLAPLFEDIDRDIIFRWTSVSDDDKPAMIRPDASINIVSGASLGRRLGCGEVKPQAQALNHRLVGLDLVRVAHLAKIASDEHKARATFAFIVVGNHATFYILRRAQYHLYTMSEIEHVQLPLAVDEILVFIAQLNKICNIIASFDYVLNCGIHDYNDHPPTLRDHQLLEAIDQTTSRKRKSITSHYNH